MPRAILLVMDSVGVGGAPDAADYGDAGADTLGHIAEACAAGRAEQGRSGPLRVPNLDRLGLGAAAEAATGRRPPGLSVEPRAAWGFGVETSQGKDTPSGHWELAGVPVRFGWTQFPDSCPAFPRALTEALVREAGLPGLLGDRRAPGTAIIDELGEAHLRTGKPICYTSADSVLQIAAHEEAFGLERLYETCRIARRLCDAWKVGRVIARPFVGEPGGFRRTPNRRDYATPPPEPTLCDRVSEAGGRVIGVGKIGDIFAHRGVHEVLKGPDDQALVQRTVEAMGSAPDGALIFANYVEFDSLWGHRRDVSGYARALEAFDPEVPRLEAALRPGDLMIVTADHGNDPTWRGTDHTREAVPILATGPGVSPRALGRRGFSDVGETLARWLGLPPGRHGQPFL